METLEIIRYAAEIVFIIMFVIVVIYSFRAIKKISASLNRIETYLIRMYAEIAPVINKAAIIGADLAEIIPKARIQYYKIEKLTGTIVERGSEISDMLKSSGSKLLGPVKKGYNLISAFSAGFKTFKNKLTS